MGILIVNSTQPRHWLHYTLASGKKDPELDPIAKFNAYSNNLADWFVELITQRMYSNADMGLTGWYHLSFAMTDPNIVPGRLKNL